MGEQILQPLDGSPLRRVLRARFSSRFDQALAFVTHGTEEIRVVQPDHAPLAEHPRATLAQVLGRRFIRAFQVSLREHPETMSLELPASGIRLDAQLTWVVHDAARVVQHRVVDPSPWVRDSLELRATEIVAGLAGSSRDEVERVLRTHLSAPYRLDDIGVSYRVSYLTVNRPAIPVPLPKPAGDEPGSGAVSWQDAEFRFYEELVRGAPTKLVAFWLMQDPARVRDVLDWVTRNKLEPDPARELDMRLASLFTGLDEHERAYLRRVVALALGKANPDLGARLADILDGERAEDRRAPGEEGDTDGGAVPAPA